MKELRFTNSHLLYMANYFRRYWWLCRALAGKFKPPCG